MHAGVVVIGRNEGERLKRCLQSLGGLPLVYVDSGSTDGSVEYAESVGARCVRLDMSRPFTAARARNEGYVSLREVFPDLSCVMFVDGDCEVQSQWLDAAIAVIEADRNLAVVCGRRRERHPEHSLYNLLCDIEWDTPVGDATACGGDALYRTAAFDAVGGFDPAFIAGEEPELCYRLRASGFRVQRIPAEMTLHDAGMTRFGQWWKRAERSGYAFFLNAQKHGHKGPEYFKRREVRSIVAWGGAAVASILLSLIFRSFWPVAVYCLLFGLQVVRVQHRLVHVRQEFGRSATLRYALFIMLAKIPQLQGAIRGWFRTSLGRQHTLVEYK